MSELRDIGDWSGPRRNVTLVREGRSEEREIGVIPEEPLSLLINGQQAAVLMRLPGMEKELAAGFCISEGLVDSFAHILMIHHCGQGLPAPGEVESEDGSLMSRNQIEVRVSPGAVDEGARLEVVRLIRAGCGAVDVGRAELPLPTLADGPQVAADVLLGLSHAMREGQVLRKAAGGVHAAALFDTTGSPVAICEDVGRHNAVDKALGHCLLRGIDLGDKMLLCSGRLSYEMITKTIRAGLPIICSVSAPTALAADIAGHHNVTLIGYLRGGRMTLYTHAERVVGLPRNRKSQETVPRSGSG